MEKFFFLPPFQDICETTLKSLIDDESVLCLLGIADRFNAGVLKANCFSYISQHVYVAKSEVFNELPKVLQVSDKVIESYRKLGHAFDEKLRNGELRE